jgi:hypothetical protein
MAPKRDTASQVAPGSDRHQQLRKTINLGVDALEAIIVALKRGGTCSITCSCSSIKNVAAVMKAADGQISGSLCPGSLLEIIRVLSSLAAVLITDQHSFEAQCATLELLERCDSGSSICGCPALLLPGRLLPGYCQHVAS